MSEYLQRMMAILLLLAVSPVLLLLWFLVRVTSPGQGFYHGIRLGKNKKAIRVWKLRTMKVKITPEEQQYLLNQKEWKKNRKLQCDPRRTVIGKILRQLSLDELPQLWNVCCGDMNLVGPRPISREENNVYGKYSELIHSIKPGITGLWQVSGRNLLSYHRRIAINIYYVKHRSFKLDLWILWKTIGAVISGRGAY